MSHEAASGRVQNFHSGHAAPLALQLLVEQLSPYAEPFSRLCAFAGASRGGVRSARATGSVRDCRCVKEHIRNFEERKRPGSGGTMRFKLSRPAPSAMIDRGPAPTPRAAKRSTASACHPVAAGSGNAIPPRMLHASPKRSRGPAHLLRLLVVALAIACQIGASGSWQTMGAAASQYAQLAAASIFCQGAHHTGDGNAPSPHRHIADQAIFNVGAEDGHAAVLWNHGPFLPKPASGKIGEATIRGAPAPPGLYAAASFPRGPPRPV